MAWSILIDLGLPAVRHRYPDRYLFVYLIYLSFDSLFQFGVLIELSAAVLRPVRALLPRWTPVAVGILFAIVCVVIWPFANTPESAAYTLQGRLLVHLQQTFSILRILYFLVLAGCSQMLSIGWRDRELQVATGLGFFSMVSVAVTILHRTQVAGSPEYHLADLIFTASYVCSLSYWAFSFAQQEAKRREFTPQMQSMLLAVAGNARSSRMTIKDSNSEDRNKNL